MLDTGLTWLSTHREGLAFSLGGAVLALTAWTCGLITRTVIDTIVKEDCDC
ncbi:hypothetical protein ACIQVR_06940 [Streptomyces xanthochromogenes]|uniref:hypothetical protein n=1 Tax=Streptomyces xanthochromogenes TaxID=67384 RepID=UPI00381F0066